jgi:hypothetical protein
MKKSTKSKYWTQMNATELRAATREFDKPIPKKGIGLPSRVDKQRWDRARKGGTKSVLAGNKEAIVLEVDSEWLKRFDQFAREHGMTREDLIERGLRSAMVFVS